MRLHALAAFALAGCATAPAYEPAAGASCTDKRVLPGGSDFWDGKPVRIEAGREVAFGMATIVDATITA